MARTPLVLIVAAGIAGSAFGQPAKGGPNVAKPMPTTTNPPPPGSQPGGRPGAPTTTNPPGVTPQPGAKPGTQGTTTPATGGTNQTVLAPAGDVQTGPPAPGGPDEPVMLPAFAEPVQLSTLIELVARTLNINITTQGEVPGTIVFNAPVPVKKSDLLGLLDALLEQQGFTITKDRFGLYTVHPVTAVPVKIGEGDFVTTKVFHTPNLRPSSLKAPLEGQLGVPAPAPGGGQARQTAYIDELGIIVATDTPRRLAAMGDLVQKFLEEASKSTFTRLELKYLSAPIARDRALQLVGQQVPRAPGAPGPQQGGTAPAAGGTLDNLGDRLTIDAQGNALIFRGLPDEVRQVQTVLGVIDVANNLQPGSYFAGSAAGQIANIARLRGLGEVITITDTGNGTGFDAGTVRQPPNPATLGGQNNQQGNGGPVMVVNEANGLIIYYGTADQQDQLKALVGQLDTGSEKVVIGVYKLKNSKADDVAQVIEGLIQNSQPTGTSTLLPQGGAQGQHQRFPNRQQQGQQHATNPPGQPGTNTPHAGGTGNPGDLSLDTGFVVADSANNQILVKAPAGQQPEFARLIEKLDLRRPQVYVEAKIVAVNWSNDMRLAFETQLINAGGAGGLLSTNFGLSSFGTSAITAPKAVSTTLGGLTGAIVKADMVPIIVNALQTKANARVLSVPQILVNDNEEAEITSVDTQPTTVTTQSTGNPIQTSAGPDEEAGTKLTVQPHISEGGYLSLKYDIELSSFTGTQTTTASGTLPSPKQVNKIGADAVTVPSDSTVIVGGLDFDSHQLTRAQIPLIGEIPLVGMLFQDRNTNDRTTTLYVFITPRILRDPTFADLRLLTAGPQSYMKLSSDMPALNTLFINLEQGRAPEPLRLETAPVPAPAPPPAGAGAVSPAPARPDEPPAPESKARPPVSGPSNDDKK